MIVPMARQHVEEVARLHRTTLHGLVSALGLPAARAYYRGCIGARSAVGFVFVDAGVVRGYALGSVRPGALTRDVVTRNPAGILGGICMGIARRPAALVWLVKSVRGPDSGTYDREAAELTYLTVAPACRGGGVGRALVEAFTAAMRAAGVPSYELSVDADNTGAIAFYERLGFEQIGRYREFGMVHCRYRLATGVRRVDRSAAAGVPDRPPAGDPPSRTLVRRAVRYGVAGLLATGVYFAAVTALVELVRFGPVAAAGVATTVVIVTSYIVNRAWVFDTDRSHASALWRFLAASAAAMALNTGVMYLSVEMFRWRYMAGLILATVIGPPTNFVLNYYWCFSAAATGGSRQYMLTKAGSERGGTGTTRSTERPRDNET